jgi:hypothetical protein
MIEIAITNFITSTRRMDNSKQLAAQRLALRERLRVLVFPKPSDLFELEMDGSTVYWVSPSEVLVSINGQSPITIKET